MLLKKNLTKRSSTMNTVIKAKEVSSLHFICPQCKKSKEIDYFSPHELKEIRERKYSENHSCCGTKYSVEY